MSDSIYVIKQPKAYTFEPQEDITPLESVWCAFFFVSNPWPMGLESHDKWPLVKRHFVEYKAKE